MIISMTGFGSAEFERKHISYSCEARTFNSKFLEITIKIPRIHLLKENEIRELVRKYISRGRVMIAASVQKVNKADLPIEINPEAINYLSKLFKQIKKITKSRERIKIDHFLKFSEVFQYKEEDLSDEEFQNLYECVDLALQKLKEMRLNEGRELEKDLISRINLIEDKVSEIESIWALKEKDEFERLKEKAKKLLNDVELNNERLELELALLLDKMDITEECVRLKSHIKFFNETISSYEPSGRKLGFIAQEILREANTISSKSSSAEISRCVVIIKEELEKIKEQIQNIE